MVENPATECERSAVVLSTLSNGAGSMSDSQAYTNASGQSEAQQALEYFWPRVMEETRNLGVNEFKNQELPLARIKKIMKLDEDVKMISAEAPVLFARAAEIFITELSLRAWVHTEDNKRRTLQRNDIAMAITKYDQFDFLIDIVPRDELKPATKRAEETVRTATMPADQVQYYFQLAQQHQAALQQQQQQQPTATLTTAGQPQIQIVQASGGNAQALTVQNAAPSFSMPSVLQVQQVGTAEQQQQAQQQQQQQIQLQTQPQVVQLQQPVQTQQVAQQGGIQIVQQVINSNGEIQQIPIQLTPAQLQLIRMQMQGQSTGQPIIIQTAPIAQAAPQPPPQQTQTLYQIQQAPGQPASVFLAPAGAVAGTQQATVQIQTQQEAQATEDDGTDQ
ncbi:nuclear transcription factor Y subunit gamma isoform X1 [Dermacentor andersoni]|uniref:nuclear transcription factor Y subunit gamma isoform X1 n=1 Tax=Dermacentor andersoni TaxID=34620 RepID=UPI002155C57B|nr:nuclear transcription factor Y subunit gamma-like isoform X1 [Dermacentor andersoni]